ncbi:hypothetical protein [Legionella sp.]
MILKLINTSNDGGDDDGAIDPNVCSAYDPNVYNAHDDTHGYDANKRN